MIYTEENFFIKRTLNSRHQTRLVFYSNKTGRQVAVLNAYATEPSDLLPYMEEWIFDLSVPVEGMNGWTVQCNTWPEVESIVNRECSRRGKAINRLFTVPFAFLKGKLK